MYFVDCCGGTRKQLCNGTFHSQAGLCTGSPWFAEVAPAITTNAICSLKLHIWNKDWLQFKDLLLNISVYYKALHLRSMYSGL